MNTTKFTKENAQTEMCVIAHNFCSHRDNTTTLRKTVASEDADGTIRVTAYFDTGKLEFDHMDEEVITGFMISSGEFNDINTVLSHDNMGYGGKAGNYRMVVTAIFGPKPVRKQAARKSKPVTTEKVIENSLNVMKEMYDCLRGMYSEQGEGFAGFVNDEKKMMDTAEEMIPYMENLLSAIRTPPKKEFVLEA